MSRANYNLWTGERKRIVANLLREGMSAAQIGAYMEISRSSVIGLVHRDPELKEIGFARSAVRAERKEPSAPKADHRKPQLNVVEKPKLEKPAIFPERNTAPMPAQSAPVARPDRLQAPGLPLLPLSWSQCRYVVNAADKGVQHLFCGHMVKAGSSFCNHHHSLVYVSPIRKGAA